MRVWGLFAARAWLGAGGLEGVGPKGPKPLRVGCEGVMELIDGFRGLGGLGV